MGELEIMNHAMSTAVLAASGSGDDGFFIVALLFAAPFVAGFFAHKMLYRRYRNHDKRYRYEHTTHSTMEDLQRWDVFQRERRRLRNRAIEGGNADNPAVRAHYVDIKEMLGEDPPGPDGTSPGDNPDGAAQS